MKECRKCGKEIKEGEEAMIVYEWTSKYDSEGLPDLSELPFDLNYPYYYHESCFNNRNKNVHEFKLPLSLFEEEED